MPSIYSKLLNYLVISMNVIWKAVQKDYRLAVEWSAFTIGNFQNAGCDLLHVPFLFRPDAHVIFLT